MAALLEWLKQPGLQHFLIVGGILFALGLYAVLTRKNGIMVLMGVELILNAANINFIAFSRFSTRALDGQMFALFVIVLAAAEVAIALAIVLNIFQNFNTINIDEIDKLKE